MVKINNKFMLLTTIMLLMSVSFVLADTDVLDVVVTEYVSEIVAYDQVYGALDAAPDNLIDAPGEEGENRTGESRTNITLQDIIIRGYINMTNVETEGNATVSSINVTINNTYNITAIDVYSSPSYLPKEWINLTVDWDNPGLPNNISIFLPELRANDSVVLNYTVQGTGVGEPLNFTEEYSNWRVMTGREVNITMNVTNNFVDDVTIYDLIITKTPHPYPAVGGGYTYFEYTDLRGEDASNATIDSTAGYTIIQWNASNQTLTQNEKRQIIFNATAPTNMTVNWSGEDDWGMWMIMGNVSASFKMNGSISGLRITNVTAVPTELRMAVSKDRVNESFYWNATLNLTNDAAAPVDYQIQEVTVWATKYQEYSDPGNVSTWINNTNLTTTEYGFFPGGGITANATWYLNYDWVQDQSISNYSILFNYSLVPIVWADASFLILDNGTQYFKLNESRSEQDGYLFIEEIYVLLGGYLMKVTKALTPLNTSGAVNRYMVNITLENIGTERTPDLVTMFDMVPSDFNPLVFDSEITRENRNMTNNTQVLKVSDQTGTWTNINSDYVLGASDTGEIISGPYMGYWGYNIDFSAINASSNGDGVYQPANADNEIGIAYIMEGNHSLAQIDNAYIVGIDPVRLEGANPSQSVASKLSVTSKTLEYLVVLVSLVVSIALLGVSFVYTRRK